MSRRNHMKNGEDGIAGSRKMVLQAAGTSRCKGHE